MPDPDERIAVAAVAEYPIMDQALRVRARPCHVVAVSVIWRRDRKENMIGVVLGPLFRAGIACFA